MSMRSRTGLFVSEGSSDLPLADLVESLFVARGVTVHLSKPKELLRACLLTAADESGRRREAVAKRFNQHRRQLLERLDPTGALTRLDSWNRLVGEVEEVIKSWGPGER